MKLASLKQGRDGQLIIVNEQMTEYTDATDIAPTLQHALDHWSEIEPQLKTRYTALMSGEVTAHPFDPAACASPLPRAYQWVDGSAYVNHVELVRKARGAEMPESFWHDPLMYQGGSDSFIGPCDKIEMEDTEWGIDFEAEIAVVTDDVPMGVSIEDAKNHIKLVMLVNDVSLRNLIPGELAKGFGFFQSKPSSAFTPCAVTPDMLGDAWDGGRLHLPMHVTFNNDVFGTPESGDDMIFDFPTLIAHAAKSRPLAAGTIVGSGTISNTDRSKGSCCIAEQRMLEIIDTGKPKTAFMQYGDRIQIQMMAKDGSNIFGTIDQEVVPYAYQANNKDKVA